MSKMKFLWSMLVVIMALVVSFCLTACGGDDSDDNGGGNGSGNTSSGIYGYYIRQGRNYWLDLFADEGPYKFNLQGEIIQERTWPWGSVTEENMSHYNDYVVYYIPDDETFIRYYGAYYRENAPAAASKQLLYRLNYGTLGTLGLYAEYTYYYTYWREGNKLYTTEDGWTVYTVTPSGIIPDGSSFVFSKYDSNQIY